MRALPLVAQLSHRRRDDFPALVVGRRFAFLKVGEHVLRGAGAPESPSKICWKAF